VFGAGSWDEVQDVDMLGVNFSDESGLDTLIAVPELEIKELEGNVRTDCDFATEVSEVNGFLCH
jgi:hypothetical protein